MARWWKTFALGWTASRYASFRRSSASACLILTGAWRQAETAGLSGRRGVVLVNPGAGANRPVGDAADHVGVTLALLRTVRQMVARLVAGGGGLDARGAR